MKTISKLIIIVLVLVAGCSSNRDEKNSENAGFPIDHRVSETESIKNEQDVIQCVRLHSIFDISLTDPRFNKLSYFVGGENIVIKNNPYRFDFIQPYRAYLISLEDIEVRHEFKFDNIATLSFIEKGEDSLAYYLREENQRLYFSFNYNTLGSRELTQVEYRSLLPERRKFEDYSDLRGISGYNWQGFSLGQWRRLRTSGGMHLDTGEEYTLALFKDSELAMIFPYIRTVSEGIFYQSPDGKYLALEAGFYRSDIFRENPPSYKPEPIYIDDTDFNGSQHDTYQYGVFVYEVIEVLDKELQLQNEVEYITFPTPDQIKAGYEEVRRYSFDGSHLGHVLGEDQVWSTAILVDDGSPLLAEPNKESEIVTYVAENPFYEILVRRSETMDIVDGEKDYWYLVEDGVGERGWIFGDDSFSIVDEVPIPFQGVLK